MPYFVTKVNGKSWSFARTLFTGDEVDQLATDPKRCFTVVNTTTHRTFKVGKCGRKRLSRGNLSGGKRRRK